jgi:hypothetical protein
LCSAFARAVAGTAVAAEFTATSTGAFASAAGTAAEVAATTSAALTAIGAFAAVFAASVFWPGRRHEDGLGRNAEERGELALHRSPETDGGLDRDDHGLNLDARTLFAARAVFAAGTIAFRTRATFPFSTRFATRATFPFAAGFTAGAAFTFSARFAARAVTLWDAWLAAFFGEAFRTRFACFTRFATRATFAFGARLTTRTVLADRSGGLGAVTREVLGQLRRVFDHADGGTLGLSLGG